MRKRLCRVGDEYAYFHCWEHYSRPTEASFFVGGAPAGIYSRIYGIVEFKDCVKRVDPSDIVFCDEVSNELGFIDDTMNDIRRKAKC